MFFLELKDASVLMVFISSKGQQISQNLKQETRKEKTERKKKQKMKK